MRPMGETRVDELRRRHHALLAALRATAERHGHDPDRLRIVGVTKTHPIETVRAAHEAGILRLGESRVQEAEPKIGAVSGIEWHFIGRLQSNKARRAVCGFGVIHSVDSIRLLHRLDELAAEEGRVPQLLLQVNVSGEGKKAGLAPGELTQVRPPRTARLVGLMAIGRLGAPPARARADFAALRDARDTLQEHLGIGLPELSMGMSADADSAAAEGATLVRIGTALFGPRYETLVSSGQ